MDMLETPNRKPAGRRLTLGLMLVAATGLAGAAWYWNQRVHAPDPEIVIRTEAEAIDGARRFLAAAQIDTSGYDLSQASGITKSRLKGQIVWRVVWLSRPDATFTNKIAVLAFEGGGFYTYEMRSPTNGIVIEGDLTNITRMPSMKWPKAQ
jgi:hypothetical protein